MCHVSYTWGKTPRSRHHPRKSHHAAGFWISFAHFFIGLSLFLFNNLLQFCVFHRSIGLDFLIFDVFLMVRGRVPIVFLLQKMRFKTKFKRSTLTVQSQRFFDFQPLSSCDSPSPKKRLMFQFASCQSVQDCEHQNRLPARFTMEPFRSVACCFGKLFIFGGGGVFVVNFPRFNQLLQTLEVGLDLFLNCPFHKGSKNPR